jgi:hypothetical protein
MSASAVEEARERDKVSSESPATRPQSPPAARGLDKRFFYRPSRAKLTLTPARSSTKPVTHRHRPSRSGQRDPISSSRVRRSGALPGTPYRPLQSVAQAAERAPLDH